LVLDPKLSGPLGLIAEVPLLKGNGRAFRLQIYLSTLLLLLTWYDGRTWSGKDLPPQ